MNAGVTILAGFQDAVQCCSGLKIYVFLCDVLSQRLFVSMRIKRGYSRNGRHVVKNPRGYSSEFSVGLCRLVPQILTQFQTKTCHFPHPFSELASKIHTRFQTFVLPQLSFASITKYKSTIGNIQLFLYYSFGVKKINTFIRSYGSLKTIPDLRP